MDERELTGALNGVMSGTPPAVAIANARTAGGPTDTFTLASLLKAQLNAYDALPASDKADVLSELTKPDVKQVTKDK